MAVPMLGSASGMPSARSDWRKRIARTRRAHGESERIQELLSTAGDLWREGGELAADGRVKTMRAAIQLVNLADLIAVTTRA